MAKRKDPADAKARQQESEEESSSDEVPKSGYRRCLNVVHIWIGTQRARRRVRMV